eukprot:PhF_6_TR696/c2_g1_i1/m.1121
MSTDVQQQQQQQQPTHNTENVKMKTSRVCGMTRGLAKSWDSLRRNFVVLVCVPRDLIEDVLGIVCCPVICVCTSCIDVEAKDEEWRAEERKQYKCDDEDDNEVLPPSSNVTDPRKE